MKTHLLRTIRLLLAAAVLLAAPSVARADDDPCPAADLAGDTCKNKDPKVCLARANTALTQADGKATTSLAKKAVANARIELANASKAVKDPKAKPEEKSKQAQAAYKNACEVLADVSQATDPITPPPITPPAGEVQPPDLKEICASACTASGTFCLEATSGKPLCGPADAYATPPKLRGNDTVVFRVYIQSDHQKDGTASLSVANGSSGDSTFAPAPAGGDKKVEGGRGAPAYVKILEKTFTAPTDALVHWILVTYTWTPASGVPTNQTFKIGVDHGKYYLEIGLLVPVVIQGSRTVAATTVPGTGGEKRLTVNSDTAVTPALALNVFPWGRRNGCVSVGCGDEFRAGDLFGFQFAVDLDLKHAFDRFYGGLVLEPVSGFSLSLGVAAVKGEFVPQNYAAGMVVPSGETFTPDTKYTPRPYFGLTLTNEVLTTITGAARAIRGTANGAAN